MKSLLENLFTYKNPDSAGLKIYLRLFELFTATYTVIYAWEWGLYILNISDVVLPLGLANYIDIEIFFGNRLALYSAALITVCSVTAFFFRRAKWLYLVAFLLLHIQYVTRFSLGEIPHSSNLVGFSMLGLGVGFAFNSNRWDALKFAFGFLIFFTGLGYFTAGISKLIGTGITWVDGNHLWLWIGEKSTDVLASTGSFNYSFVQEIALQSRTMATLILTVGLLTELTAFLMWWKKPRPFIITGVIVMHIGIYYSMNIFFLSYMIELVIIGYPWYKLIDELLKSRQWSGEKLLHRIL